EIRNNAHLTNARGIQSKESARSEAAIPAAPHVCGRVRAPATCSITRVVGADGCLVRHDEDVANGAELLRRGRDEGIPDENVLVFLFHNFVASGGHHLHNVFAGRQDSWRRADGTSSRIGHGCALVSCGASRNCEGCSWCKAHLAGELVHAVVWSRLYLAEIVVAIKTLVLRVVGDWNIGIQVVGGVG